MNKNSPELVKSMINAIESEKFDKGVYDITGVFVVKNAIPQDIIKEWQEEWKVFYADKLASGRNVNQNNPVDLKEKLPGKLAEIYKNDIYYENMNKELNKEYILNTRELNYFPFEWQ